MHQQGSNNCSIQSTRFVHYLQVNAMYHFKVKILDILLQIYVQLLGFSEISNGQSVFK